MSKFILRLPRRKLSFFVIPSLVISMIFIIYQIRIFYRLSTAVPSEMTKELSREKLVRGIHIQEERFYTPVDGKFTCIKSGEVIAFSKVNDDYCDCADSSDEPGTNACPEGTFYCSKTTVDKNFPKMVPSSKVNDGICDCCDGSEEYGNNQVLKSFERSLQKSSGHFLVPCPNMC